MNLANKLTVFRAAVVPFFVFFLLTGLCGAAGDWIALAIFIVAAFTDLFDGKLARKYNLVTNFGKFMDPLADKLLVCSALICLVYLDRLEPWIAIIIIAREFIISGFRLIASDQGIVIAASMWGKVKTVIQMIMIGFLIGNVQWAIPVGGMEIKPFVIVSEILKWTALALTIISLIDYMIKNRQVLQNAGEH
ncbi:MAG: CDP-diacylglycerol--glycerol-3-phosphate 3-phosphatidyltransferase [Lachnospiraceae bacterium]|nr:CDP-diacylglycerol--glycerol-3-phosphate 3-phosphatidyltransferase [Lachnospiraceae bacterium]